MITIILRIIFGLSCGIILAKMLEYLFEVRWKQAQDVIVKWLGL